MSQVTLWYSSLSEEKQKMIRRGLWVALALVAGLGILIWKTSVGPGEAAPRSAKNATQSTAASESKEAAGKPASKHGVINGFRSAKFGADEAAIRAAIKSDFSKSGDDIRAVESAVARTKTLAVRVTDLIPETGEAEIGYVLGYKSKDLIQVNILWGTPVTPETTGVSIAKTALLLKTYFAQQNYDPKTVIRDRKIKNGVLAFQAMDAEGHLVRLIYREIPVAQPAAASDGKKADAKEEKKVYTLTLAYVADPKSPDIFRIEKGAF